MNSKEIRSKFLDFFKSKGHEIVDSAPMVIKDDPTLMFTNAGMNQFKDLFLGYKDIQYPRIADSQKCLRVSGKHNDLEEVGVDTYHHTMFEMLGNWSFGDYFKKEAIEWAWELLTEVYKIDPNKLYVTIFEGDKEDNLELDSDALDVWKSILPEERIIFANKKDNFWEMGDTGPCGPCSEIHIDLRSEEEKKTTSGRDLVNMDHPQVIEIWNLVFMEFNRNESGKLLPLPNKHIDTGMGFERLAVALQGKTSNYDTDIFQPLIKKIAELTGQKYEASDSKKDISFRVISDHVRAVSFSIADGQIPSNTGAGYVIRRILRRAIRYSYSFLDIKEAYIYKLVDILVDQMGDYFKELKSQKDLIKKVIQEEEESFLRTLAKGIDRLEQMMQENSSKVLDGAKVFELYDTYGFPVDLTSLIAEEQGQKVDEIGFNAELEKQKERSRKDGKVSAGDWTVLVDDEDEEFIGYDFLESEVRITRYRKVNSKGKDYYQLVFNLTPFYPEGGGQVGDSGIISNASEKIVIRDTKKENNLIIHIADSLPQVIKGKFLASVDAQKRKNASFNHTSTHLLHYVLREVLGTHVEQKGSLVHPDYLRFDFSHFAKVSAEELSLIESKVNTWIRKNDPLQEHRNLPLSEAKNLGAMMLFGEKYGDVVRMIEFGDSKELCGGIHVERTGDIGYFKITAESAVASGIRRIEAISASKADEYLQDELSALQEARSILKNPADLSKAINDLQQKNSEMLKEIESFKKEKTKNLKVGIASRIQQVNGINFIAEKVDLDAAEIKNLAFQLKGEYKPFFAVFGTAKDNKPVITCVLSEELAESHHLNAGKIIRELAIEIEGGGGGQAFFATAGGKKVEGLDNAIKKAINYIS